ncbi:MAG: hypothetical protein KBT18_10560 [Comamonas sp.]|nr:hypothetical protein [Candidatus Comamonas equi]
MSQSERIGIAAHLHVALRRKAGRVTDIDWMAVNDVYAHEVVRIAKAKAEEDADAALLELAHKLELLLPVAQPHSQSHSRKAAAPVEEPMPLVGRLAQTLRESARAAEDDDGRYVGGLR